MRCRLAAELPEFGSLSLNESQKLKSSDSKLFRSVGEVNYHFKSALKVIKCNFDNFQI